MNRAVWLFFLILTLSISMVFAQSDQTAVSSNNDETQISAVSVKAQKVSEMRSVTIKANLLKYRKSPRQIQFDEKGGIIVPNASKGIKQTNLTPDQKRLWEQMKNVKAKPAERKVKQRVE